MQDCGSCKFFIKWRNDKIGGGLCDLKDTRTKTDRGHKCKEHKSIKFKRKFWTGG